MLEDETGKLLSLLEHVTSRLRSLPSSEPLVSSLHALHMAQGDILCFRGQYMDQKSSTSDLSASMASYESARVLQPSDPKAYLSLAKAYHILGDRFASIAHVLKAMSLGGIGEGHEFASLVFEEEMKESQGGDLGSVFTMSLNDHIHSFKRHFIACAGIIYTRLSADHFTFHLDCLKKHLPFIVGFLRSDNGNRKTGHFLSFDRATTSPKLQDMTDLSQAPPVVEGAICTVDALLCQAMVCTDCLLRIVSTKHNLNSAVSLLVGNHFEGVGSFDKDLHRIRCLPGLNDVFSLLLTQISSPFCSGVSSYSVMSPWQMVALNRTLRIFLTSMKANEVYWLGSILSRQQWRIMEEAMVSAMDQLSSTTKLESGANTEDDDYAILNFWPFEHHQSEVYRAEFFDAHRIIPRLIRCKEIVNVLRDTVLSLNSSDGRRIYFDRERSPSPNACQEEGWLRVLSSQKISADQITERRPTLNLSSDSDAPGRIDYSNILEVRPSEMIHGDSFKLMVPKDRTVEMPKQTMSKELKATAKVPRSKQIKPSSLIVIDAANVAMRHGLNLRFSSKGIAIALLFFRAGGHRVIGFIPVRY